MVLYLVGTKQAYVVSVLRVILAGFMFGNLFSIIYGISGAILSLSVMLILYKSKRFHMVSISCAGGIAHNLGQIIVASIIVQNYNIMYYFAVLMIAGCITGIIIGFVACEMVKRIGTFVNKDIKKEDYYLNKIKINDIILIIAIIAFSIVSLVGINIAKDADADIVRISVDGEIYGEYSLEKNNNIEVVIDGEVQNVVTISDGKCYMSHASCPDKLCVNQGAIHTDKQSIICLPNKVVVEVVKGDGANADDSSDDTPDAIVK